MISLRILGLLKLQQSAQSKSNITTMVVMVVITRGLMNKAIEFAKTIVDIPDENLSVIMQSRKTLFSKKAPWVKKEIDEDFDVPMGCYNGAEDCEILESYLWNLLGNILDKDLTIVTNLCGPEIERKRKAIIKLYKECGLNITIQTNLTIVNFLDVEMNLDTGTYRPYRKPDNKLAYINRKSNHPPTMIKEVPKAIAKRISDISSSELVFNHSIPVYSDALRKCGFHDNITFIPKATNTKTNNKKTCKCKIIWLNPPYCLSVKTNVGRYLQNSLKFFFPKLIV